MSKNSVEVETHYDPNVNGVNKDIVTYTILKELDLLEANVYNGDLSPAERGAAIRANLKEIREKLIDVSKIFVVDGE